MFSNILIIDDEQVLARAIADFLARHRYLVNVNTTGEQALKTIEEDPPDIVLLDYRLPRMDGLKVLRKIKEDHPEVEVIMMTAYGSVEGAVEAMKLGALDYISKPIDLEELRLVVEKALESVRRLHELNYLRSRMDKDNLSCEIVGESEPMRQLRNLISQIASIEAISGREAPAVLITGETGTGKELVARAIHAHSPRSNGPFVEINCAAIPLNLLEAELFGYEKGAFTDAKGQKIGLFEAADRGTLFLDEIGSMDLNLQGKLLKAIEEKSVRRLGSIRSRQFDVMLIAATNQPLEQAIRERAFREDLYYRLKVLTIHLPPLRQRNGDPVRLAEHFVRLHARRYNRGGKQLSETAKMAIAGYNWPGNVRELSNVIERAVLLKAGQTINTEDLGLAPPPAPGRDVPAGSGDALLTIDLSKGIVLEELERTIIERVLLQTGWNRTKAAQLLGLSRETLRYRIEKHNLKAPSVPGNT
ncbi:MAG: sigma-54-dependent Fis family transcriptional regulator [Deltaproteobacteria bacterium]|nr:sigma-54-dependent Fis family transcriptional regulator [Deltaproteobacteria bacterium]